MSFTKEKFLKLSTDQKIKKVLFALNDSLKNKKELEYPKELLTWLNEECGYDFNLPVLEKDVKTLIKVIMEILKKENPFTEDIPFDSIEKKQKTIPVVLVLENIRSPHNTGSIIRSAEALGAEKVYLTGITPDPVTNTKISKTSRGAEISVEYIKSTHETVLMLKKKGYKVYSLEKSKGSINIKNNKIIFPCALVLGNEEFGVSMETLFLSDAILHIDLSGIKNSLNVSVASGIALFELSNRYIEKENTL